MKVEKGGGKVRRRLTEVDSWTKISAWLVKLVCLMLFEYAVTYIVLCVCVHSMCIQHQLAPTHDVITERKIMKHYM